jgi:isoleucyl-tRNA synthetase
MGNPGKDNAATPEDNVSLEEQLNTVVKGMEFDEKTNTYKLPEDIPEHLKLAAIAEKRRRDTQASLTRSRQELKKLEEANKKLQERVLNNVNVNLTEDQLAELEELKYSDPDTWRVRMNEIEKEAKQKAKEALNETFTEAEKVAEMERRQLVLQEFLTRNPGLKIDDDVIANDIPPRITRKLDSGEISFEEFLEESKDYLKKAGYVIQDTEKTPSAPNLGKAGGRTSVSKRVVEEDIVSSYKNEVY